MSGRKPRDERPPPEPTFHNDTLREKLGRWKTQAMPPKPAAPAPAAPKRLVAPKSAARSASGLSDEALFRAAMEDVQPIAPRPSPAGRAVNPEIAVVDEEAEALARLAELVATGEGLDLADTDEYFEGLARGVDASLIVPLRRGDFSVQAHLDLHGLGADAAHAELERFLVESRRHGHRCVLVVHGRGLHSKDQQPIIKERIGAWLTRGKLSRLVLAFATARPVDGGAGALYVLLRR